MAGLFPPFPKHHKARLRSARAMVPICQSPTSTISGKCKTYEWKGLLSNTLSLTFWLNYQSNASNYMSLLNYYIILYLAKLLKWFTTGGFSLRPNNQSQWLRSEVCWSAWPFCLSTRLSAKKRENKYVLICSHVDSYFQWITFHQFPSVSSSFSHHFHIMFPMKIATTCWFTRWSYTSWTAGNLWP